ncbi:HAD-IA family hydrolase [Nocardioides insulae]|uniref:HAD-IA family hydrolase n=1 Tax=Nocardioides insulae TaxID=394734 RepID=UPI0003FB1C04|nr:HAD-IA family hydrolase [Nocardioides insulae]
MIWDLGNVVIRWDPFPAVAAGVGAQEAHRFLAGFDFGAWNHACDAGRGWAEALAVVEREAPQWLPHARSYVEHFPSSLVGEVPGTAALLRELHAAGVPQYGLTNWSAESYPHAPATFDVVRLLHGVTVSGEVGLAKPDPAIYRIAIDRSGLRPDELLFVDDRAENVAAAAAVGLDAVRFTGAERLRAELRARALLP